MRAASWGGRGAGGGQRRRQRQHGSSRGGSGNTAAAAAAAATRQQRQRPTLACLYHEPLLVGPHAARARLGCGQAARAAGQADAGAAPVPSPGCPIQCGAAPFWSTQAAELAPLPRAPHEHVSAAVRLVCTNACARLCKQFVQFFGLPQVAARTAAQATRGDGAQNGGGWPVGHRPTRFPGRSKQCRTPSADT